MADSLSTTSFAVLGMFAIRPWTPYELNAQIRRSLAYCWPVSERAVYNEPERLRGLGLVELVADESAQPGTGSSGRPRRTYRITDAGRAELRAWLATRPAPPKLFHEPLLRLLLADHGSLDDLVAALSAFRDDTVADHREGRDRMGAYLDGDGPFPERAHLVASFSVLIDRLLSVFEEWTEETLAQIQQWPSTSGVGLTDTARRQLEHVTGRSRAPRSRRRTE